MKSLLSKGKGLSYKILSEQAKKAQWAVTVLRNIGGSYKKIEDGANKIITKNGRSGSKNEKLKLIKTGITIDFPSSKSIGQTENGKPHGIYRMESDTNGEWVYLDNDTKLHYVRPEVLDMISTTMRKLYNELMKDDVKRTQLVMTGLVIATAIAIGIMLYMSVNFFNGVTEGLNKLLAQLSPLIDKVGLIVK